jgi:hypothetical protein
MWQNTQDIDKLDTTAVTGTFTLQHRVQTLVCFVSS